MPTFEQGDVIKVPFPYTDRATRQSRPALVVSTDTLETAHGLLWVAMITSAANRGWPGDVAVKDLAQAGLPAPSVIRTAKIATIESSDARRLGRIAAAQRRQVIRRVVRMLGVR
ncbi:MAG: type II toxin-antitoxin system PemK/MazF family toxin [Acidobacteria bacterium]|nr:type II toxin-antitoxin system PemK/MazF family toxin [Chloroflexota bacterium]MYN66404.1 type II toxin-antitoxin system PemK/MazF family toxin [Acidobacteriota bacterium]